MTHAIPDAVSLDEVVAREIPVQWDEAVAVVEELCGLLTSAHARELPVPHLADVLINADGTITLPQGSGGERGARGAGRTLHALLSTSNAPVALRLFVTHATSPEAYASIREFAAALAYFGKPGRAQLIGALYQRCAAAGSSSVSRSPRRPSVSATKQPGGQMAVPPKRRPKLARAAAVATAVSLVVAGIWLWSTRGRHRPANLSFPTLMSEAKSAIRTLELEVSTRLGIRPPPIGSAEHEATRKPTPASGLSLTPRRTRNERPANLPLSTVPLLDQSYQTQAVVPLVNPSPTIDALAPRGTLAAENEESRPIYSSSDADVRPPVLRFPQAPPPPMVDRRSEALNRMELVISPSGTVEHVRLVAGPSRMTDMMLLSGAKMWRFEPALKDGEPVRYRMIVSWIGSP